jgi:ABC-type lipoprotein export system ATPase subunit
VDWVWVKDNANLILDVISSFPGSDELINSLLSDISPSLTLSPPSVLGVQDDAVASIDDDAVLDYIDTVEVFFQDFLNVTLSDFFNTSDLSAANTSTIVTFDSLTYDSVDGLFVFSNVQVTIGGTDISVGDITVSPANFVLLLPDTVSSYQFYIPSAYTVMHNSTSPHGIAAFHGELTATAFRTCSPAASTAPEYLIKNHPLPITVRQEIEIKVVLALLTSLFILVPLCYIPASFVSFLVKERVSKSKHLQIVSSVSPYLYWVATYAWDMTLFILLVAFVIAAFYAFGSASEVFIHSTASACALVLLLVVYGCSAIPLSYLYSMGFENFSTAQISIMVINFITGFVMVLAYYILINVPTTKAAGELLVHFFRFFPTYNVGEGLINLSAAYYYNAILGRNQQYFDFEVTGRSIIFMAMEAVGYFLIVLLTEFSPLRNFGHWLERKRISFVPPAAPPARGVDLDVEEERVRVSRMAVVDVSHATAAPTRQVRQVRGGGGGGGEGGGGGAERGGWARGGWGLWSPLFLLGSRNSGGGGGSIGGSGGGVHHAVHTDELMSVAAVPNAAADAAADAECVAAVSPAPAAAPGAGSLPTSTTGDLQQQQHEIEVGMRSGTGTGTGTPEEPACSLLIRNLVKTYPASVLGGAPKHAVRGVSLACLDGERFGLLGINGAGKSTILSILTGDLQPTSGEVYIAGKPLSDPATMSMIGYCPQVDPLLDLMNGYETLWFFGRIRGIPGEVLALRVDSLIQQVGLERFARKPCGTYSGGNKRKLSLAVALIGDPRVLFLDEVRLDS